MIYLEVTVNKNYNNPTEPKLNVPLLNFLLARSPKWHDNSPVLQQGKNDKEVAGRKKN